MWRVYRPLWQDVYASALPGEAGQRDCVADFGRRWARAVEDGDWQVLVPEDPAGLVRLQLRLAAWTGEFGTEADAWQCAGDFPGEALVLPAGSPEERDLLDYGRRQIRA